MPLRSVLEKLRDYVGRTPSGRFGLLLSGGGARASYQAGVLHYIAESFPDMMFPILTGVSAGAINAAHLATHEGSFSTCTSRLVESWMEIRSDRVFSSESSLSLVANYLRSKGKEVDEIRSALLDTEPLRAFLAKELGAGEDGRLVGIEKRLRSGMLGAVAVVTTNYATGQTVTWVQGSDIDRWERPSRVSINTALTVDHVMASTALPLVFPAIRIGSAYYGDGGVRLSAPLAPVVHLGANRILAISTRYARSRAEADEPSFIGYPPVGQIFGLLLNSIFLDALDQDALSMDRINALLDQLPKRKRLGLRPIELLVLRPSTDLGKLAAEHQAQIGGPLTLLARAFGGSRSTSPDWLSMLLFDSDYVGRLIEIGFEDARRQHDRIERFVNREPSRPERDELRQAR